MKTEGRILKILIASRQPTPIYILQNSTESNKKGEGSKHLFEHILCEGKLVLISIKRAARLKLPRHLSMHLINNDKLKTWAFLMFLD